MKRLRNLLALLIIVAVLSIGFVLLVPHTKDTGKKAAPEETPVSTPTVSIHDTFKKGVHTITGSLFLPNACTLVTATAALVGDSSSTQAISVALSVPPDTGICLQQPTKASFTTTVTASSGLPLKVTVNGAAASTTTP